LDFYLLFDLHSSRYWVEHPFMSPEERESARKRGRSLPRSVRIADVWISDEGKKAFGVTGIRFSKKGYAQHSAIHLASEDGRSYTLVVHRYLKRVEIFDRYVVPDVTRNVLL
jgi:hypothetical protein